MYKYKRNGFTLVELMAVIIIISLIALLTFPNIINQIKKTKKSNNKMIEDVVIEQAKKYVSDNTDDFQEKKYCFSIDTLVDKDYVKDEIVKINDFINKKVVYITNEGKYEYNIVDKDKCNTYDYVDNEGNGYTEVEYIESTGEQYIDTAYYPNESTEIDISFNYYTTTIPKSSDWNGIFGVRDGNTSSGKSFGLFVNRGSYAAALNYGNVDTSTIAGTNIAEKTNIKNIGKTFYYNGQELIKFENNPIQSTRPMYIFASNLSNVPRYANMKLYYFKIKDNNSLIRDYIPVIDKNEIGCLFDNVEKKCYYNNGDGRFLTPHEKPVKKIDKYSNVNYIHMTGKQYIDTEYSLWSNSNWKIELEYELDTHYSFNQLFGSLDVNSPRDELWSDSSGMYCIRFLGQRTDVSSLSIGKKYTIVLDNSQDNLLNYIDGELVSTINKPQTSVMSTLGFGHRFGGGYLKGKVYILKFWSNGQLVRDYIPVLDDDGVPCLLDNIEKKCYYSFTGNDFLYG